MSGASAVNALILTGFGLNCDYETAFAFEKAGADAHRVHINSLIRGDVKLSDFRYLHLAADSPGGTIMGPE